MAMAGKINNRIDFTFHLNDLGYKIGAEVGTANGRFALTLVKNIPNLRLYCIDAYKQYGENEHDGTQAQLNLCFSMAQVKLKDYDVTFIRKMSLEALNDFPDNTLDFVYIDANHLFDYVMQDIIQWSRKVRRGGIVAGHDYWNTRGFGVVDAVDAYVKSHNLKLNVFGGLPNDPEQTKAPNWFFVK